MRNMHFVIVAATVASLAIPALASSAFARAAGGNGGAAGAAGPGPGPGGGAGAGSNPNLNTLAVIPPARGPSTVYHQYRAIEQGCYKYEPLYDRFGNTVDSWHREQCF